VDAGAPSKRPWWRPKVPTGVVVTLVGIALTAWLLPAFTRQWDDRQKAQELKANLVAQMSSATVKTVFASRRLSHSDSDRAREETLRDAWLLANLQMEARLRTYFSPSIVNEWSTLGDSVAEYIYLPNGSAGPKDVVTFKEFRDGLVRMGVDPTEMGALVQSWRDGAYSPANSEAGDYLLQREADIAQDVLDAHTNGYSTTTRDLVDDLLPF
jgi:hypothetical protein